MNVIIFGSTGRTGQVLIQFALEAGHEVTAFARNPDAVHFRHSRLKVFQGDATQTEAVNQALEGQDAVLFAVGTDLGATNLRQTAMKNILAGMKLNGVKRLVGIGGMGILQASEDHLIYQTSGFPAEYIPVSEDHLAAWKKLQESNVDYTFVCPPMIQNGPQTGHFEAQADYPPDGKFFINTGDLAFFMIEELQNPRFTGHRVGITAI
jgi:putative NADH-flavin reductase